MRSFTDIFIKHPVLAIVVNLVIVLVGWRALTTLPVQQYPKIESSSVVITTVYNGASAETVRGFLTTPIERVVSAIGGVDYIESTSRAGVSTVTVRLEAEPQQHGGARRGHRAPAAGALRAAGRGRAAGVEVQRADRPYASFYLSFTSTERSVPAVTDWLSRTLQPQLATLPGVQRVTIEGGRPIAMRVWIDPDRLAALNLSPGDVQAALQRNNYLAAVGQTKGNLVQVNLLANTDLRSVEEFEDLIVAERGGAIVRLSDVARVELGAEEADLVAKYNEREGVYLGVWPLLGSNEIDVAHRLRAEMERIRPTLPKDIDMQLAYDGTMFMENALKEITQDADRDDPDRRRWSCSCSWARSAPRSCRWSRCRSRWSARRSFMLAFGFSLNLLTILAIVLSVGLVVDDAIVVVENVERHVREGKSRIEAALVGARELVGPIIAMTITLAAVYTPIGFQGGLTGSLFLEFAITLAAAVVVSGIVAVTLSPVMSSRFVHPQGKEGRLTALVNRGFDARAPRLRAGCSTARWRCAGRSSSASLLIMVAAWPLYMFSRQELAPVEDQSHISLFFEASPDSTLAADQPRVAARSSKPITAFPEADFMWSLTAALGRLRRHGRQGLEGARRARPRRCTARSSARCRRCPGLRVFPRLDPPLPTPGQYDVELVLQSDAPPEQMLETVGAVRRRRLAERQVPVRRHRPEDRPAGGARRASTASGSPTSGSTSPASARSSARCSAAPTSTASTTSTAATRSSRRSATRTARRSGRCSTSRSRRRAAQLVPVSTFTRIETSTAPRTLNRFQQRNAVRVFGGVAAGRHQGRRPARARRRGRDAASGPGVVARLRRRVAPDPPRRLGAHRHARASRSCSSTWCSRRSSTASAIR